VIVENPSIGLHETAATAGPANQLRIIVGSALNRAIEEWPALFGDALLASAAMDRLLHHAHVIAIEGDSYRNPPPRRSGGAKASAAAPAERAHA